MNEDDIKEMLVDALQMHVDDCEVKAKRKGILLSFMSGEQWLVPDPVDLNEDEEDDDEEEDEE